MRLGQLTPLARVSLLTTGIVAALFATTPLRLVRRGLGLPSAEAQRHRDALTLARESGGNQIRSAPMVRLADRVVLAPIADAMGDGTSLEPAATDLAVADRSHPRPAGRGREWWLVSRAHPERASIAAALALAAVAVAVAAGSLPDTLGLDPTVVLFLVGAVVASEALGMELFAHSSYSIAVVPTLAAAMLLGLPGATVVAPIGAVVRGLQRHSRWYKVLFNASAYLVAAAAASWSFHLFGVALAVDNLAYLLVPATIAGVAFYAHTLLVAGGMATELRRNPVDVWADQFRWLWPQYVVLSGMGLLFALAYQAFGVVGAAAFAAPPLMMRLVAKQYVDRTVGNVRELRKLNQQLADEMAERGAVEEENLRLAREAGEAEVHALRELSRMKSEFISIASHELRTPMTTILGFTELLLDQTAPRDPNREILAAVYDDSVKLAALVDDLLDVSRIETGRLSLVLESVDLERIVASLLPTFGPQTRHHTLVARVNAEARWVVADVGKLSQILTNLVANAIKYSPEGGRIEVVAERDERTGRVRIAVSDEGLGIPEAFHERIFERFQRVDSSETRRIRGTGLGLYIVKHLVELHGGAIAVDSELGHGSTFHFTLEPSARTSAGETETGDGAAPSIFRAA